MPEHTMDNQLGYEFIVFRPYGRDSTGGEIPIESFSWSQYQSGDGTSNGEYVLSQVSHSATDESGTQYAEVADIDLSLSAVDMGGTPAQVVEYAYLLVA